MPLSVIPPRPQDNRLLALLRREDTERLQPHLEPVRLVRGAVLYESGQAPAYLYFPTTAIISLVYTTVDGATAEMGVVGNEGVLGVALFMNGHTRPNRAIVQVAGGALRLGVLALHAEFQRGGSLQQALLRYTLALLAQVSQASVCNLLHPIEQRLCRWLLLICDRAPTDDVLMTHEYLAQMLGVRRASITTVAQRLRMTGLIRYQRGRLTLLDRPGLEMIVCECYRVVRDEYTRLLG
jgi:CRP-like cAMP-binding protein